MGLRYRKIKNSVETVYREHDNMITRLSFCVGLDARLGGFQLKRIGILRLPELPVTLHCADEPRLSAWRV
jgi:hypothetical protein